MKKKKITKTDYNIIHYISIPLVFLIGFGFGILYKALFPSLQSPDFEQIRQQGYEYINPLIDFETVQASTRRDLLTLENDIETYISQIKEDNNDIKHISVYFKDLNTGAWIGIEEKDEYIPASLIKVPLMIALYKKEEKEPGFLQQKIVFKRSDILYQEIPPEIYLTENEQYTIDELINQLIIYSDNTVLESLYSTISDVEGDEIFLELGIPNPYLSGGFEDSISVKDYASFFRILYNASYLSKELSFKALSLLAQSQFDEGITAGIPDTLKVANKFGERSFVDIDNVENTQIHDCGIVYNYPKPYLLCIMTKGSDKLIQTESIKEISEIVYSNVTK